MNRYTANYINADSNFEIFNIIDTKKTDEYHQLYCVLLNLLQRGCPTKPSVFLSDKIDSSYAEEHRINFFSKDDPQWGNLIKGDYESNRFPARTFYDSRIPALFPEYPFLRQIMLPEAQISDFCHDGNRAFYGQAVDFLLEPFKLVIEVDGSQHQEASQRNLDAIRDEYLTNNGYTVIRIPSSDVDSNKLGQYKEKIDEVIKAHGETVKSYLDDYNRCTEDNIPSSLLKTVATIRFQMLIIQLCLNGILSLNDPEWKIAINNHEINGYEDAAVKDVLLWLKNLCILSGIEYKEPSFTISQTSHLASFDKDTVKVDFSLFEKTTPLSSMYPDRIYVRNCWDQDKDYFKLRTAAPIKYHIEDFANDNQLEAAELNPRRVALRFMLKNLYGFDSFRPGQERIVMNALRGRSTIGVLPTGSGKSLCYQMAVFLQPCVSFCICPIKSLMIDQDENLKMRGIEHTAYLSSDLTGEEREQVQANFASGRYLCIFMSPERFQSEDFRKYLSNMSIKQHITFGYAVLDEVHCLSEWGHSFRVSYLNLVKTIRKYCKGAVLLGLTATASFNVLKNILIEFEMNNREDVISIPSFTRPELSFKVITLDNDEKENEKAFLEKFGRPASSDWDLAKGFNARKYNTLCRGIINRYHKFFSDILDPKGDDTRCGLIFTAYVNGDNGCYNLSRDLTKDYQKDVRFFAGEKPRDFSTDTLGSWDPYKRDVQESYKNNVYALLCATKAFGMGIDKPNVRYTVHYGIPDSLESLYQEAGRAGRDKKSAECTVIYARESKENELEIRDLLALETPPSKLREYTNKKENFAKGADVFRQLTLLAGQAHDVGFELGYIDDIVREHGAPGNITVIRAKRATEDDKTDTLQALQKEIYHLSLVGVVDDWTVDWKVYSVKVYFSEYTAQSVYDKTERYIRNYDPEYSLTSSEYYKAPDENDLGASIHTICEIFLHWYADNILYTRRQALINVMEACDRYEEEGAEAFKDRMEAYFRLDDISDILGNIADQPRDVETWFEVLNIERIKKKETIPGIIMNLNRFLESFQANVGLNYISGFLHLCEHHFDEPNGKDCLTAALDVIKTFKREDREYVLIESAKLINELDDPALSDEFAEFFMRNYEFDETDLVIYKYLESNYALQTFLRRMMVHMKNTIAGGK